MFFVLRISANDPQKQISVRKVTSTEEGIDLSNNTLICKRQTEERPEAVLKRNDHSVFEACFTPINNKYLCLLKKCWHFDSTPVFSSILSIRFNSLLTRTPFCQPAEEYFRKTKKKGREFILGSPQIKKEN